jgi:AraC-like DNA-binding protein/mannose-6-phosphate isomerase-like protein (cupin superfamily)
MQNKQLVFDYLKQYTDDEQVYRRYHELQDSPRELKSFLESLDPEMVRRHYLLFREFSFIVIPKIFRENSGFEGHHLGQQPVTINKHLRYTPVFVHQHDFFEIVYILTGTAHQTLDRERLELKKGDICFIPPYTDHTLEIFDDSLAINIILRRDTFEDIFFNTLRSNDILSRFFMSCLYSKTPMRRILFSTGDDEEIQDEVLSMVMESVTPDEYSDHLLSHMVPVFFAHVLRKYRKTVSVLQTPDQNDQNALNIISYINDHYKTVSLKELSGIFHYSISHISRLIRKETGTGFAAFVREIRLTKAASLLRSTDQSIAHISEMVGYENPETFIRAFERTYQVTPSVFRKNDDAHPDPLRSDHISYRDHRSASG